jgi:predicted ATPase
VLVQPPTGTVTFLFTDIEGSTRRWQDEPEAMRALLVEHDSILGEVIDKRHGHLFKHTGDGVAAAFASATDAVAAAVEAQELLREVLPVRMGLHTGEAELRDGDYFGSTVNRCARLMGVAHGGQVVCSESTASLVRDRKDLRDLGEHRLRDLSRAERVWQVGGGEFPALRSLDSFRSNLPVQLSSFVGREDDLVDVANALRDVRIVTITGVGGVGKTRLALQTAADVIARFPDGVFLAELAAVRDPDLLPELVRDALGVRDRSAASAAEALVQWMRDREMLLVLDNCEHVLDAAAAFAEGVVRACPGVRLLATSREGLGVLGERMIALRSMRRPLLDSALDEVVSCESVRLFADRAADVSRGFSVTDANAPAIVEICRRLDGIPLAIELAAARVQGMSPSDIARRLDRRFRLLTGGNRTALERHRTLRATVDWSYELLTDAERAALDRLSVFVGGWTLDAAEAVISGPLIDDFDVVDCLSSLVRRSLIIFDDTADEPRYRMLETIRQYAAERLDADGLTDVWRRRHALWMAEFMANAGAGVIGPDGAQWHVRLRAEMDNLGAAVEWAADSGELELAAKTLTSQVLMSRIFQHEGLVLERWALRLTDRARSERLHEWPQLAAVASVALVSAQRFEEARQLLDAALLDVVDAHAEAMVRTARGFTSVMSGDADEAVMAMERAVQVARRTGDSSLELDATAVAAAACYAASQASEAHTYLSAARMISEANDSAIGDFWCHWMEGMLLAATGSATAEPHLVKAIDASSTFGMHMAAAIANSHLIRLRFGRGVRDMRTLRASLLLARDTGDELMATLAREAVAHCLAEVEPGDIAAQLLGAVDGAHLRNARSAALFARARDLIIAKIGADAFDTAHAAGKELDDAMAFRLALTEVDRMMTNE